MKNSDQYWDGDVESLSRSDLESLQLERWQRTLQRVTASALYQKKYAEAGIHAKDLKTLDDVRKLPLTTKQDLREHYPYGLLCVPRNQLVRLHVSSGTTGQSIAVLYTRADLDGWAELLARSMYMTGARPGDVFQNLSGYGLFTGGLGFQYGAERLGLLTIPSGSGNSKRQLQLMRDFATSVIHIIPSYALRLMDVMMELGIDSRKDLQLRLAYLGAEPYSEEVRRRVEEFYGIRVFNSYGLSEMNGPGVAFECLNQAGMHVWEDAYYVEIIDPETLVPVPDGVLGELVLTIIPGQCPCGSVLPRHDKLQGRSDDMFIFRAVNIYPGQIEHVLVNAPGVSSEYNVILDRREGKDFMTILVEREPEGDPAKDKDLGKMIEKRIKAEIMCSGDVEIVDYGSLPRSERKSKRVYDNRGQ